MFRHFSGIHKYAEVVWGLAVAVGKWSHRQKLKLRTARLAGNGF